jgi:major membrane immunogen (membrane-anchored lipoprotein)
MKRILILLTVLLVLTSSVFAASLKNGVYFAQDTQFGDSGWKDNVTIVVKNGKISDVSWNGSNVNAGMDKETTSKKGLYKMVEYGSAIAPWWKQAEAVEKKLLSTQDVASIRISDAEGHTDAVSGATIHVSGFVGLVKKALAAGPVGYGPYKDGLYHAEEAAFDHGYKYAVDVTVTSGYIVAVNWDGIAEDGSDTKAKKSMDGKYGMVANGGAMAPWWEQARAIEDNVINSQKTSQPDAVSGATIGLDPFYTLLGKALSGAKR